MNFSNFFISRPIFATVLAIILTLVGAMAMRILPIEQYPSVVPPRLMLATAGLVRWVRTQSMPAMTPELVPPPLQSSTRTGTSPTRLATPQVLPPTVPATWVPWCDTSLSW